MLKPELKTAIARHKRGYSTAFHSADTTTYFLNPIPVALWTRVRLKAARDGISMRALILRLLTDWEAQDRTLATDAPKRRR